MAWAYAARLKTARGTMRRTECARQLSALTGRRIVGSQVRAWESGTLPRCAGEVERWVRQREPVKTLPPPRPHIGLSFSLYLDNGTKEEADRVVALMDGLIAVIRARWPEPSC